MAHRLMRETKEGNHKNDSLPCMCVFNGAYQKCGRNPKCWRGADDGGALPPETAGGNGKAVVLASSTATRPSSPMRPGMYCALFFSTTSNWPSSPEKFTRMRLSCGLLDCTSTAARVDVPSILKPWALLIFSISYISSAMATLRV